MNLNARVDVNFARDDVNFQTIVVPSSAKNVFILISLNTKVSLIHHTKYQLNIQCHSVENVNFIGFAI